MQEEENWHRSRVSYGRNNRTFYHELAIGRARYLPDITSLNGQEREADYQRQRLRIEQQLFLQTMASMDELEGAMPPALDLRVGKSAQAGAIPRLSVAVIGRITKTDEADAKATVHQFWERMKGAFPQSYGFFAPDTGDAIWHDTVLPGFDELEDAQIWEFIKRPYSMTGFPGRVVGTFCEMFDSMRTCWDAIARCPERVLLSVRVQTLPKKETERAKRNAEQLVRNFNNKRITETVLDTPMLDDAQRHLDNLLGATHLFSFRVQVVSWCSDPLSIKATIQAALTTSLEQGQRRSECFWRSYNAPGDEYRSKVEEEMAHVCVLSRFEEQNNVAQSGTAISHDPFLVMYYDIVTSTEANAVWQLPLARRYEIAGIEFKRDPLFTQEPLPLSSVRTKLPTITLGTVINRRDSGQIQVVDTNRFTRHALVLGEVGSGKSTTTQSLVYQLWRVGVPSLVIDPVSTEYSELWALSSDFRKEPNSLCVFTPGSPGEKGLLPSFNPFCPQAGISLDAHIMTLKDCFGSALALSSSWKDVISRAIRNVYEDFGWPAGDIHLNREPVQPNDIKRRVPPTLIDFIKAVEKEIARYKLSEFRTNTEAALLGILHDLAVGPLGALVNTRYGLDVKKLVERPAVIELRWIRQSSAKSLIMLFLLTQLRQYYDHSGRSQHLRHVLIIEEAHRLLSPSSAPKEEGVGNDSRTESIEIVVDMLAELRKAGVGVILVEQLPSRLDANLVKLPGVKILHRLSAKDDREIISQAMNMTPEQVKYVATLLTGQATFYAEGFTEPILLQMTNPWGEEIQPAGQFSKPELVEEQELLEHEVEEHTLDVWRKENARTNEDDKPWNPCQWCRCRCQHRMLLLEEGRDWWRNIHLSDIVEEAIQHSDSIEALKELAWSVVVETTDKAGQDDNVETADEVKFPEEYKCGLVLALEDYVSRLARAGNRNDVENAEQVINKLLDCIEF